MLAVMDFRTPKADVDALLAKGVTVCKLPPHPALDPPVSAHPDMLLFFAPDHILCTPSYAKIAERELTLIEKTCNRPIRLTEQELASDYPHDIALNALPIGKHLFCHVTNTARELLQSPAYQPHRIRQGYAKCAAIPVGAHALITADPSLKRAAEQVGVDVLQISAGGVTLAGYDMGFLGGAASFAPYGVTDQIYFCGALEQHPDAVAIHRFCRAHGRTPHALTHHPLTDVGTIFLL
ncbi:MAG: hypothetical protein E7666_06820 [Ruminococcaceae bacterium]|nr:hypothetical protein [Oscillospiraceae bacterium]